MSTCVKNTDKKESDCAFQDWDSTCAARPPTACDTAIMGEIYGRESEIVDEASDCCKTPQNIAVAGNSSSSVGNTDYYARNCEQYQNLLKRGGICPAGEDNCCPQGADQMPLIKPQDFRFYPLVAPYSEKIGKGETGSAWYKDFRSRDSIIYPESCEGTDECDKGHFAEICCKEGSKADFLKNSIFPTYFHLYTMLIFMILGISIGGLSMFTGGGGGGHVTMAKYGIITLFTLFGAAVGWHLISSSRYSFQEIKSENEKQNAFSVGAACSGQQPGGDAGSVTCGDKNCLLIPKTWKLPDDPTPSNYTCKSNIPFMDWFAYAWNTTLSGKILFFILALLTLGMILVAGDRIIETGFISKVNPFGKARGIARAAARGA